MNTQLTTSAKTLAAQLRNTTIIGALALFGLGVMSLAYADDTVVYLKKASLPAVQIRPNVVLILDSSGSMGLPLDATAHGTSSRQETTYYDDTIVYPGDPNFSGGAGDSNYYYLYSKPNTFADQYIYFAKVHTNQMACTTSIATVNDATPYTTISDRFVYDSGATPWTSAGTASTNLCSEYSSSCGFTASATGPLVDCDAENKYIPGPFTGTSLYVVSANFHNFLQGYYRYSTLLTVMRDLIDQNWDINMALMRFNGGNGGWVFQESLQANDPTNANQTTLKDSLNNLTIFDDSTPLAETLWEANRYLRGMDADYGNDYGTGTPSAAYSSGTTYNSPIDYACQKSHIIILTDGDPNGDSGRDSQIEGSSYTGTSCSGNCMDELAGWIRNDTSNAPDYVRDHSSLVGDQTIKVHTIAFGPAVTPGSTGAQLLSDTAAKGDGLALAATDATQLQAAFDSLLSAIDFEADTNVAPAVAVNAYTGLQHRDELYFALFKPAASPRWNGNVKKYKLVDGVIKDANGNDAIDAPTGFFDIAAESYWFTARDIDGSGSISSTITNSVPAENYPDADDITRGGVAYRLDRPTQRKMYTYTGAAPIFSVSAPTAVAMDNENIFLDASNLANPKNNTAIAAQPTLLGSSVTTAAYAETVINWSRGGDTDEPSPLAANSSPPNYFFPDAIHNPPVVVTYDTDTTTGTCSTTAPCFTDVLYAATNMGTLHAIDPTNGDEKWSFVPKELLPNLTTYYEQNGGFTSKIYGLDGEMKVWRNDINGDGTINGSDHVYLYQPMRRGGSNIYAFDLTDPNSPEMMWEIVGSGLSATPSGDYRDLAQTWSAPQRARINWGGTPRDVLFFGGGYDPVHDTATAPVSSSKGNAIYMVDAKTSELLWSAGNGSYHDFNNSAMDNSFAADVTTADVDGDSYIDFLYAVDIQGNVWRFDFDNSAAQSISAAGITGGMVAQLGGTGSDFRRFYNAPDAAFFSPRGKTPYLTISIPSGYRAQPLSSLISDYLFVFFDSYPTGHPTNYNYAGGSSTIDPTNDLGVAGSPSQYGWKLPLSVTGEKGLASTITFNGSILMTTYLPDLTNNCDATTGEGRFYMLNALTGTTTLPDPNAPNTTVLFQSLTHGGIPPKAALIYGSTQVCASNCSSTNNKNMTSSTKITACVGTECLAVDIPYKATRAYWREN